MQTWANLLNSLYDKVQALRSITTVDSRHLFNLLPDQLISIPGIVLNLKFYVPFYLSKIKYVILHPILRKCFAQFEVSNSKMDIICTKFYYLSTVFQRFGLGRAFKVVFEPSFSFAFKWLSITQNFFCILLSLRYWA